MLTRPEKNRCIECGKLLGAADFAYHEGRIENGPAYWCDRGILCSIECSLAHHRTRMADGSLPSRPAQDPFDAE